MKFFGTHVKEAYNTIRMFLDPKCPKCSYPWDTKYNDHGEGGVCTKCERKLCDQMIISGKVWVAKNNKVTEVDFGEDTCMICGGKVRKNGM